MKSHTVELLAKGQITLIFFNSNVYYLKDKLIRLHIIMISHYSR